MSKRKLDVDDKLIAEIAVRCFELREARGLSLKEAGDRAGFTKSHMWEFEQGRSVNPTIRMLLGLARAYGVSLEHIVGISTGEPPLHPEALRIAGDIDRIIRATSLAPIPRYRGGRQGEEIGAACPIGTKDA